MRTKFILIFSLALAVFSEHAEAGSRWQIGSWTGSHFEDRFERHKRLEAHAQSRDHKAELRLVCYDGLFAVIVDSHDPDIDPTGELIVKADNRPAVTLRGLVAAWRVTAPAKLAEVDLASAHHIAVRMKTTWGPSRDYDFDYANLALGKPQVFGLCRPTS